MRIDRPGAEPVTGPDDVVVLDEDVLAQWTRYVRRSLWSWLSTKTSREPRFGWPIATIPSISLTTAGSLG